uniref:SHSP domain-containing protein n=1 Tax=Chrysemys picta bellii TaxID=8478 RepID=A0A8C3FT89_CHRPI
MPSCSRYLVRLLPLRRWPSRGFGPTWVCSSEPGSPLLGPAPKSCFEQVAGDVRRHLEEMARIRRAVCQAQPPLRWEPAGQRQLGEAGDAKAELGSPGPREEKFQLSVDVAGFSLEELTVRLEGRSVMEAGKREKQSTELHTQAVLPEDVDLQAVTCSLSRDGQLCIQAPRLAPAQAGRVPGGNPLPQKGPAARGQPAP